MREFADYPQLQGVNAVTTVIKLKNGIECVIGAASSEKLDSALTELFPNVKYQSDMFQPVSILNQRKELL